MNSRCHLMREHTPDECGWPTATINEFKPDPLFQAAFDLWKKYYDVCETFDRIICTGASESGSAMPSTSAERRHINNHASAKYQETLRELNKLDVVWKVSEEAKTAALREHEIWVRNHPYAAKRS